MRITARQLRQIIKEELQREVDSSGYDINPDLSGLPDEPMVKMPAVRPGIESTGKNYGYGNMMFNKLAMGTPYASDAIRLGMAAKKPPLVQELNDITHGKKVLRMGDSGDAVKIVQIMMYGMLSDRARSVTGINDTENIGIDPVQFAKQAVRSDGANVTLDQIEAAITNLIYDFVPDGNFGPKTFAATVLIQLLADHRQTVMNGMGDSVTVEWRSAIDGIVGRQTIQYLMGMSDLAAPTGLSKGSESTVWTYGSR